MNGYGAACNRGARAASGGHLLILNNDLDFDTDFVSPLLAAITSETRAAMAGPGLRFRDGRYQPSYGAHPTLRTEQRERARQRLARDAAGARILAEEAESARVVDWLTGAVMLIRREAYEEVGGFDERYFFYFEDVDLCTRLRAAGYTMLYRPEIRVTHFGGGSSPQSNPDIVAGYRRGQLRFYARHNSRLSFLGLKLYLALKFAVPALAGEAQRNTARAVLQAVRRSRWRAADEPDAAEAA
jgi:N-acetylglucosaminyl-diphospho-decaprenol L-rhamnosyltransferase